MLQAPCQVPEGRKQDTVKGKRPGQRLISGGGQLVLIFLRKKKRSSTRVLKTRALSELKTKERLKSAKKENGGEDGRLHAQHFQMDSTNSYHFKSQI